MNPILQYPVSVENKRFDEIALFGLMGILLLVGMLYFLLYFALGHIVKPSSQLEENIPTERTIVV